MKNLAKLSLVALAAALATSAFADDLKFEVTDNSHGGLRYHYRNADSATVAVYAQGRGYGMQTAADAPELRLDFRDNGHGGLIPQYVAVK